MTTTHELILDCDPGIDDALALFVAAGASDRLHLRGVTCVAGNRPVATTTDNACRVLKAAGRGDVPVYAGAARPLTYPEARCNLVHGEDGLGGVVLAAAARQPESEHAVNFIVQTLLRAPEHTITIVAIGPLTNLALAEVMSPGVLRRSRGLSVMGGAVSCPGNITPQAEFNFYADPLAAHIVLGSGSKLDLFGLDVTSKAVMPPAWIESLARVDSACSQNAYQMLLAYAAMDPLLHDACPIAHLIKPELFSGSYWKLQVDCGDGPNAGQVTGSHQPMEPTTANAYVLDAVDCDGLMSLVKARLALLP